jgi:hypothetical protein
MKKMMLLMLALLIWGTASMNAQVTIGSDKDPDPSAVLDLQTSHQGLLLPRVALLSNVDNTTVPNPVAGLVVYNTTIAGNGLSAVTPGMYAFSSGKWQRLEASQTASSNYPAPTVELTSSTGKVFNFYRKQDTYGDPNGPTGAIGPIQFTVTATGGTGTLKYQWYKKSFAGSGDIKLSDEGATTESYTTPATDLADWGLNSYYCVVSDNNTSVSSPLAEVAIGCGAKTVSGDWLKFMCYNLGADTSLDPSSYYSVNDTTSYDIKGWLFQWGRIADGHQWRSSDVKIGIYNGILTEDRQIPEESDYYGKYILSGDNLSWGQNTSGLWNRPKTTSDPCPTGWRVPTFDEFASVTNYTPGYTTMPYDKAEMDNMRYNQGLIFGISNMRTLFLPAAGSRARGSADLVLGNCIYATTTPLESGQHIAFYAAYAGLQRRTMSDATSQAVRCIAE